MLALSPMVLPIPNLSKTEVTKTSKKSHFKKLHFSIYSVRHLHNILHEQARTKLLALILG